MTNQHEAELHGWREILVHALDQFFLQPPASVAEGLRRALVVLVLFLLSGGSYVIIREPEIFSAIAGRPAIEQTMSERIKHKRQETETAMEEWFYRHRPRGLMLIAWDELRSLKGIWVKPVEVLGERIGVRRIQSEIRNWAGPFVFGECVTSPFKAVPNGRIAACPILTSRDVWGYVAFIYTGNEMTDAQAKSMLSNLAEEVTAILYQ